MKHLRVDGKRLLNAEDFHDCFASTCNFPSYYGRNMNAWIDCMGDYCLSNELVSLVVEDAGIMKEQAPQLFEALVECSAFINWRSTSAGGHPIIALSYFIQP